MSMSKKDFIIIADELRFGVAGDGPENLSKWDAEAAAAALCRAFRRLNPQFKEDRWREYLAGRCGPNGGAIKAQGGK